MSEQQPVLPAEPWYTSEVQVRAVIAMGAQLLSIIMRIIGHYTTVSTEMVDAVIADLTQGAAIVFGALAIMKRQTSKVAPLTLTANGAALHTIENPPLLNADPTKIPKEPPNAT